MSFNHSSSLAVRGKIVRGKTFNSNINISGRFLISGWHPATKSTTKPILGGSYRRSWGRGVWVAPRPCCWSQCWSPHRCSCPHPSSPPWQCRDSQFPVTRSADCPGARKSGTHWRSRHRWALKEQETCSEQENWRYHSPGNEPHSYWCQFGFYLFFFSVFSGAILVFALFSIFPDTVLAFTFCSFLYSLILFWFLPFFLSYNLWCRYGF